MTDLALVQTLFDRTAGRVRYRLGAKVPLDADSHDIEQIDCSGFVRWILARAGGPIMPDGSQNQLAWCRDHLRPLREYADVQFAQADPSRLFIAFLSPKPGKAWPRHVWLVCAGRTMESASGKLRGVGSRPWNTPPLDRCRAVFEVPTLKALTQ